MVAYCLKLQGATICCPTGRTREGLLRWQLLRPWQILNIKIRCPKDCHYTKENRRIRWRAVYYGKSRSYFISSVGNVTLSSEHGFWSNTKFSGFVGWALAVLQGGKLYMTECVKGLTTESCSPLVVLWSSSEFLQQLTLTTKLFLRITQWLRGRWVRCHKRRGCYLKFYYRRSQWFSKVIGMG